MSDYTPTTQVIRMRFVGYLPIPTMREIALEQGRQFDRWLAAHDAEVLDKAAGRAQRLIRIQREAIGYPNNSSADVALLAAIRGDGEPANCIHVGCNRQGEHEHDGGVDDGGCE